MKTEEDHKGQGLDLLGLGTLAKAIPKEVYERTTATLLSTFQKLTAPITETTSGLGRYLHQKFDTMVEVEKAIAIYTVEQAIQRAQSRRANEGKGLSPIAHPKGFVKTIEEASKETDPLLHEMWTNLLATQLVEGSCHPHFVEVLPHFSPAEAQILASLLPKDSVGEHNGGYLLFFPDSFKHWIRQSGGDLNPWSLSCELLLEFRFADLLSPKKVEQADAKNVTILYKTRLGEAFLTAVSPKR